MLFDLPIHYHRSSMWYRTIDIALRATAVVALMLLIITLGVHSL